MDQPEPRPGVVALVVEDETIIRMETADLLDDAGFDVIEAWNAATALRQLERRTGIRLLVTDVHMPGALDGFGLARTVAARWPDVAILVISGVAEPRSGDLPEGARFIPKPFTARIVREAVMGLIGAPGPGGAAPR